MNTDKDNFSFQLNPQGTETKFKINPKIYSLNAIYQAAYLFLNRSYIFLDGDPKKEILVTMKIKGDLKVKKDPTTLKDLAGEFYNELLNQLLREKISKSNAKIREYIVAQALYNAVPNEVDELLKEVEEEDWQDDPLGISKTWEEQNVNEKMGKKSKKKKVKMKKKKITNNKL